jgi:hypothetical protein
MNLSDPPPTKRMNQPHRNTPDIKTPDIRRILVLILAIGLLATSALLTFRFGQEGSARFAAAASGRIGLVLGALWLAWPSLQRPSQWLPPGIAVACVVALVVLAAQPRLIVVAIPALGALLALAAVVRSIKR